MRFQTGSSLSLFTFSFSVLLRSGHHALCCLVVCGQLCCICVASGSSMHWLPRVCIDLSLRVCLVRASCLHMCWPVCLTFFCNLGLAICFHLCCLLDIFSWPFKLCFCVCVCFFVNSPSGSPLFFLLWFLVRCLVFVCLCCDFPLLAFLFSVECLCCRVLCFCFVCVCCAVGNLSKNRRPVPQKKMTNSRCSIGSDKRQNVSHLTRFQFGVQCFSAESN